GADRTACGPLYRLELEHVCTEVAEERAAHRTCPDLRNLHRADAGKGQGLRVARGHGATPIRTTPSAVSASTAAPSRSRSPTSTPAECCPRSGAALRRLQYSAPAFAGAPG